MFNRSYIEKHKGHPHYVSDSRINTLKNKSVLSKSEEKLSEIFSHLSDPTKLRICRTLHKVEEVSVKDIALILEISDSAVSHALSDLKKIGLVGSHRCGKLVCYSINSKNLSNELIKLFES